MISPRNVRQAMRSSARRRRSHPNDLISLKLEQWRQAKAYLDNPGPRPLSFYGVALERTRPEWMGFKPDDR